MPERVAVVETEGLGAHHRGRVHFNKAVVLFKDVVKVFDLKDLNPLALAGELENNVHHPKASQIGPAFFDNDPVRHTIHDHRSLKESPGGSQITMLAQQKIKSFAVPINGAMEVGSPTFDLDVVSSVVSVRLPALPLGEGDRSCPLRIADTMGL